MEPLISVTFYADLIRTTLRGGPFPDIERSVALLLATVAQESAFTYTRQLGGGPARGLGQVEPATEHSLWVDYLAYHDDLSVYIASRCGRGGPDEAALEYDMVYGILLMRTLYLWRDPAPMPPIEDLDAQWESYKQYYNTYAGAATQEQFLSNHATFVAPYYPEPRGRSHA